MIGHPNLKDWLPLENNLDRTALCSNVVLYGTAAYVTGVRGTALRCTKTNGGCAAQPASSVGAGNKPTSIMTLCAWVSIRSNNAVSNECIGMTADGSGNGAFYLGIDSALKPYFYARNATSGYKLAVSPVAVGLNEWHHLCGTYDGSYNRVYVDGEMKAELAHTGNITYVTTNAMGIGSTEYLAGRTASIDIDDIQLYHYALPVADIKRVMHGLHPLTRS